MQNGVDRGASQTDSSRRAWARDALGAIALVEGSFAERIFAALGAVEGTVPPFAPHNTFGEAVVLERGPSAAALIGRFVEAVEAGHRATLIAGAHDLTSLRATLRSLRARRIGAVVHVMADRGVAEALALGDLGWGMLFAAGVGEALDLALVARRAAEDSGTPFFVVHERGGARHVEPIAAPSKELVEVFVGPGRTRIRPVSDAAHPIHIHVSERAFAERVPFALASAMRELESLTGRRRDVLERLPAGDAAVMMIAIGELGESVIAGVERLRAQGQDVGAIKLTALRPFPGARVVKAMARALAITVLEADGEPLAQSAPLAREVKAAFADAITWAPEYPGIGRIPRIASGLVAAGEELEAHDLDAIAHNMLADEKGKRTFVVGGEGGGAALTLNAAPPPAKISAHAISMRGRVRDAATAEACAELCTSVVSSALGLHVRASVRRTGAAEGEGFAFDLLASRDRPRGAHAPHAVRLVALEDAAMFSVASPLARLADDGVLAVPTQQRSADAVWSELPAYAKAIVFDRHARILGWTPTEETDPTARRWLTAAAFAGLALASAAGRTGRAPVDGSLVAREVAEALRAAVGGAAGSGETVVAKGAEAARKAFEAHIEVPRATIERDEEAIRLGRRDTRASQAPR
jgi:Pyruvate:ferredoxin oxidoreductase core domain II/Pyruvate flavodoxin/ferredoxin oxidoreductase, thiamine diP-bdg